MAAPITAPVFQIHPSLRCNFSCAHCYSSSGPYASTSLNFATVRDAIADAAKLGYGTVSVSGGEPFLYRELPQLLAFGKELGLRTTVTTNGSLLQPRRLKALAEHLDLLAISLDGDAVTHEAMRRDQRSYARIMTGIETVRACEISFGFIHTLTRTSWEHVENIVEFAAQNDARLVQVHPLELTGRAAEILAGEACDETTLAQVYLLVQLLNARHAGQLFVQYDVVHVPSLGEHPELVYADENETEPSELCASGLAILVLEADGTIVPMSYGFGRAYTVANVRSQRLRDAWPQFAARGYAEFRRLCRTVYRTLTANDAPKFANWYELLHTGSLNTVHARNAFNALV